VCVIGADHPESAISEGIDDAGFVTDPTAEALTGERPPTDPIQRASTTGTPSRRRPR
jgi:hypothetical protein